MTETMFDDLTILNHSECSCPNREDVPEIKLAPASPKSVLEFWRDGMPSGYDWIPDKNQEDNN